MAKAGLEGICIGSAPNSAMSGICKFTYEFGGSDHDKRPQVRLSGLVNTCLRAVTAAESHTASSIQLLYSL
jgi:hypothetical protein